jgi:cytochrome c peroxidase
MNRRIIASISAIIAVMAYFVIFSDKSYRWQLPKDTPPPIVPANNPMSEAKVKLGRHLFYDTRLSANNTISCASCHHQSKAFTDGEVGSTGLYADITPRNAMGLTNVAYNQNFTWANPLNTRLEHQARGPLFGETPPEMGLTGVEHKAIAELQKDSKYQTMFKQAYPEQASAFTMTNIIDAIATFERTLLSFNSPYDKYLRGESNNFGDSQKRGMTLFFSEKSECFHCHGGFNFSDSSVHENATTLAQRFHNNGLYNIDGKGGYPKTDRGLYDMTSHKDDMGKFKAPTLRNIAVTAPFMHDGSIDTLEGVLAHYVNGGTNKRSGKNKGFGSANPFKSEFVPGLELSEQDKTDLLNFLRSLTDETFLNNPDFSDPWSK